MNRSRIFVLINTSQSASVKPLMVSKALNVVRSMSIAATTPAFTFTWEIANTASTASSPTPSRGKSSAQNQPRMFAENSTTTTTAPKVTSVVFHTTCVKSPAFTTLWESANSRIQSVAFHTRRRWMSTCHVFLTSWGGAKTITARINTTWTTSTSISPTKDLFDLVANSSYASYPINPITVDNKLLVITLLPSLACLV